MNWDSIPLRDVLHISKAYIPILDEALYVYATLRPYPNELSLRGQKRGSDFQGKRHQMIRAGQFVISRTRIQERHWGIVQAELDETIVHRNNLCFDIHPDLNTNYFAAYLATSLFDNAAAAARTKRGRLDIRRFLRIAIPLPSLEDQTRIAETWQHSYRILKHTSEMYRSIADIKIGVATDLFQNMRTAEGAKTLEARANIECDTAVSCPLYITSNGKLMRSAAPSDKDVIGISPNAELDPHFLYFYLAYQKPKWYRSTGITLSSLVTALQALQIPLPSLYEQRKIATILHQHDDVLQKLKTEQRELSYLTRGMMQQIFEGTLPLGEAISLMSTL